MYLNPFKLFRVWLWRRRTTPNFFANAEKVASNCSRLFATKAVTYLEALSFEMMVAMRMAHLWAEYKQTYDVENCDTTELKTLPTWQEFKSCSAEMLHRSMMLFAIEAGDKYFRVDNVSSNFKSGSFAYKPVLAWFNRPISIFVHFDSPGFFTKSHRRPENTIAYANITVRKNGEAFKTSISDYVICYILKQNAEGKFVIDCEIVNNSDNSEGYVTTTKTVPDVLDEAVAFCKDLYINPNKHVSFAEELRKRKNDCISANRSRPD